jgi:hypothetical protein
MADEDDDIDDPTDLSIDLDDMQREQLHWELDSLKARVAELEGNLVRVTNQRDAALAALGASQPAEPSSGEHRDVNTENWQPSHTCRYCEGEGVIWVHDFRMDCKRCGGSGVAREES